MTHFVRLLCDSRDSSSIVTDALSRQLPFFWSGNAFNLQIALAVGSTFLTASDVTTIAIEIKPISADPTSAPLVRKVYAASDCNASFAGSQWDGGAESLLVAPFTAAEASLGRGRYRLIVIHTDSTGRETPHLSTALEVGEDYYAGPSTISPPTPAAQFYDRTESDTRYPSRPEIYDRTTSDDRFLSTVGSSPLTTAKRESLAAQWPEAVKQPRVPSLLSLEQAKTLPGVPLDLTVPRTADGEDYDLTQLVPLWGWWKVRAGASTTAGNLNQTTGNGQAVLAVFDSSGNDNKVFAQGGNASYWISTNTVSTGKPSMSFGPGRLYSADGNGAITAAGASVYLVADSDVLDATTPQVLFSIRSASGVILSLEQRGTILVVTYKDGGGALQVLNTSYTIQTPLAFSVAMSFDRALGTCKVVVNNQTVGDFSGLTFTSDAANRVSVFGDYDGTTVANTFDGQLVEFGLIERPVSSSEMESLMHYLISVSGLPYVVPAEEPYKLLEVDEAAIQAQDADQESYNVALDLPAGLVSVGVVFNRLIASGTIGETLSVTHPTGGGSTALANGLDNLSGNIIEDGLVFESTGGAGTLSISVTGGEIKGIIVRAADDVSNTVEDQGTGTHCFPLAIRHSNKKLYRVHCQIYDADVYLSNGEGQSVKVFDGINRNDHYHNGAACIELDNGSILVFAVGHNTGAIFARTVSADLQTLSGIKSWGGFGFTYLHAVKRKSDGSVYLLTRTQGSLPYGAGLLRIDDPENITTTTSLLEKFAETNLRLYPRKLVFYERDDVEYLVAVWSTRSGAEWQGLAAVYFDLNAGQWKTPEGTSAPNATAPYFRDASFTGSIEDTKGTGRCVIKRNGGEVDQWYVLNDVAVSIDSQGLSLATLVSTSLTDSAVFSATTVNLLTYVNGGDPKLRAISEISGNTYRVDCQFLETDQDVGILVVSERGARTPQTDPYGDSVPLYYDWYGEDFRAFSYVFEEGEMVLGSSRVITTQEKSGLTHGWLVKIDGELSLDVQVGRNWYHHTHAQATRQLLEF